MSTANTTKLYSTNEAAAYLGIHLQTMRYHLKREHLNPDYEIGGHLAFSQSTLDKFRQRRQAETGYTMVEAAAYLSVKFTWLRYHVYISKRIKPDARSGNAWIFTQTTLDAVRAEMLSR